ncbi:GntR family transcriptional regulator [Bacillus horti]|uniref:DNA-binding transcriptional regulator YhcF (GntR family) n=1 Tax=Caldalkalibacillus horti TaxID=77523 RepID=A0ABT9VXQ0_9BACI|nr:GntR family transcriptional regulator [Bacillus horti]MDQ0165776.1 DNA-binding transcriptional regulator YhcF (GntR family) [Bacillus horti]
MKYSLDESKPIFIQIAEGIEDEIINGSLKEGGQVPSTNQFASYYQINPATAAKGINLLVEEKIIYKKRGIGMFVSEGAKAKVLEKRKEQFFADYVLAMLKEAQKLNISSYELIKWIESHKQEGNDHEGN